MKNPLVVIEDAIWRTADGAILWLWNEHGMRYTRIMDLMLTLTYALGMFKNSKRGTEFGLDFWIYAGVVGIVCAFLSLRHHAVPSDVLTASNLSSRRTWFSRVVTYQPAVYLILLTWSAQYLNATYQGLMFLTWIALNVAVPTKPRRRKPREVRAAGLAWAGGAR